MTGSSPEVTVRPEAPADRAAVRALVRAAFGDHGPAVERMRDALDAAGAVVASLVALRGGEPVGHVQLSHSWLDARERLVDVLVLSPLSVRPDVQGGGIGTTLLAAAVRVAGEAGAPAVFLEGSPDYYRARGFARGDEHGFTPPSARIPPAAFQVVVLPAHDPWMTGALVYRDAFWATDTVGLRDPLLAQLGG